MSWPGQVTRNQWNVLIAAMLGWMLDAMDFVLYLMAITTLEREFHFDARVAGSLASVALLTSAAGGLLLGVLSDYIGRARALMATILVYSLCSLGTATSQNLTQLVLWRAALGIGMGGEWSSGAVLVSETWPPQHRGKAIGLMQSGWAIGYILAALIAALVLPTLGWRWLFVVGVLPALLVLWIRRKVQEPEMWREEKQKGRPSAVSVVAIFKNGLAAKTILATLMTGAVMFGYWGLFTWLPAFLATPVDQHGAGMSIVKSVGWIVAVQTGAFFGYSSFGFISDRIGRRPAFVIYLVAAAIIAPVYGSLAASPTWLMILGPALGFFGHGYFSLFGAMLAEVFPTAVRGTGQGFTYNTGRAISAFAPFTIGYLARLRGIGPALGLTSAFFIVGALMIFLMPETRAKSLGDA